MLCISFSSLSQSIVKSENLTEEWQSISNKDGVEILLRKSICKKEGVDKDFSYGFIRIINSTNEEKDIQFRIELTFTDGCTGCDNSNEDIKTIHLKPNASVETDCSFSNAQLSFLINNPFQLDHKELVEVLLTDFKTL